jgi:hypothetical protein
VARALALGFAQAAAGAVCVVGGGVFSARRLHFFFTTHCHLANQYAIGAHHKSCRKQKGYLADTSAFAPDDGLSSLGKRQPQQQPPQQQQQQQQHPHPEPSPSLAPALSWLKGALRALSHELDRDTFRDALRGAAAGANALLYDEVATEARFSAAGGARLAADVAAVASVFQVRWCFSLSFTPPPQQHPTTPCLPRSMETNTNTTNQHQPTPKPSPTPTP